MADAGADTRTAVIEGYAGKAAEITRKIITRGFATLDGVKAFFSRPREQTLAVVTRAKTVTTTWIAQARTKAKAATAPTEATEKAAA